MVVNALETELNASLLKHQLRESENLGERIITISCKRVHGATRKRPVKR